jgi:acyl phosphate:glycerol-3-phosphate acyltransferase
MAKGWVAVWLAGYLTGGSQLWMPAAAVAVMAGHAFNVFLGGKGGKAVASFAGAYAYLTPLPLAATLVVFVVMVAWTRHISAGSIVGAAAFPLAVWLIVHPEPVVVIAAAISAAIVIVRHRENVERLHAGSESVFTLTGRSK